MTVSLGLEDKVWKVGNVAMKVVEIVGNMAMNVVELVMYHIAWAKAYLRTKCHFDPSSRLATTYIGRKLGGYAPLEGAESPSNTMSPGPRPTALTSGNLIHPGVWPQQTWAEN